MSDTPRTDAINTEIQGGKSFPFWSAVIIDHARTLERELAAMTAAKELAERQVDWLVDHEGCQPGQLDTCKQHDKCRTCRRAWSRAEAEKGAQG